VHSQSPLIHLQMPGNWALGHGLDLPDLDVHRPTLEQVCLSLTHGTVEATREVPKMGFPFVVYAIWRAVAQPRPFLCPECGASVQAD
jgi:hypothetical protein